MQLGKSLGRGSHNSEDLKLIWISGSVNSPLVECCIPGTVPDMVYTMERYQHSETEYLMQNQG